MLGLLMHKIENWLRSNLLISSPPQPQGHGIIEVEEHDERIVYLAKKWKPMRRRVRSRGGRKFRLRGEYV